MIPDDLLYEYTLRVVGNEQTGLDQVVGNRRNRRGYCGGHQLLFQGEAWWPLLSGQLSPEFVAYVNERREEWRTQAEQGGGLCALLAE